MPTILRRPPSDAQINALERLVKEPPDRMLDRAGLVHPGGLYEDLTSVVSPVGTSKFLHFSLSSKWPIWDSVIAGVIRAAEYSFEQGFARDHNRAQNPIYYARYFDAVHDWIRKSAEPFEDNFPNYKEVLSRITGSASAHIQAADLTTVRKVELGLFWLGILEGVQPLEGDGNV